jgi:hypothetical protein
MSEQNEPQVVDLVDAGVPADQGLSSLGLLMQLAGNVLAAYAALITFMMVFALGGGGSSETLWLFVVLGLSIGRSMFQRSAGTQLLYGRAGFENVSRLAGVRRYVLFALAQSVMVAALLAAKFHVPTTLALGILGGLVAWPVTLAVLLQLPRFKRFQNDIPVTEDKGFEGAAILMSVLGMCGLIGGATVLIIMVQAGSELTKGAGVLLVLTVAMLVVRSFIHVQAGFSGLRTTSVDKSVELSNRYANFGVISSFCGGGALLLFVMSSAVSIAGMALITGLVWMLMAWPLIIRRFFSDRQFADLLAGDNAPVHRRAPDAGITALGWLLLAYAMFSFSFTIPGMVAGGGGGDMRELQSLMALGGAGGMHSMWFNVGVLVLQAWAGYELIRMSPQSRIIATVFGVVGVVVAVYMNYGLLHQLRHMHGVMGSDAMGIGPLALQLIVPVATIVLVNRKLSPTARARFKTKPTEA